MSLVPSLGVQPDFQVCYPLFYQFTSSSDQQEMPNYYVGVEVKFEHSIIRENL